MKTAVKKKPGRPRTAARATGRKRGRPPGRPSRTDVPLDTRERILDAAEAQFSAHGFWGVTIREVAEEAKVDTALLHYYFNTKRGLFDSVFSRRAEIMNRERIDSIDAYEKAHGANMTVEGVINAFLQPTHDLAAQGDPGWHNYFALVAQVNNTPAWGGETMGKTFDRVIHRLLDALRKVLPDTDEKDLFWSYHFLSGALTLTLSQTGRIDRLSNGLCKSSDFTAIHSRMVPFIASGFERLCRARAASKSRK